MSEPKRYDIVDTPNCGYSEHRSMAEEECGDYVLHADYVVCEAEILVLRRDRDAAEVQTSMARAGLERAKSCQTAALDRVETAEKERDAAYDVVRLLRTELWDDEPISALGIVRGFIEPIDGGVIRSKIEHVRPDDCEVDYVTARRVRPLQRERDAALAKLARVHAFVEGFPPQGWAWKLVCEVLAILNEKDVKQ